MAAITLGKRSRELNEEPSSKRQRTNIDLIPWELLAYVFTYLNNKDLAQASSVCREWRECVDALPLGRRRRLGLVHGRESWAHLGSVGEEPPIPDDMGAVLAEPCSAALGLERFGTTIGETHILVLIPATLNGERLDLDRFKALLDNSDGPKIISWDPGGNENNHATVSYWALISKGCIANSKYTPYDQQKQMVKQLGETYRLPKLIEMVFGLYLHEVACQDNLYPSSVVRCEEMHSNGDPMCCHGFGGGGGVDSGSEFGGDFFTSEGIGVIRQISL